ncbi:MAG: starch-binding protein [Muribaculaceae bacterium]|nr:starch-binding protein [Muribaculaceae bacterium]
MKLKNHSRKLRFSISRKALICATSFLLSSGLSGLDAYADYCYFEKPDNWSRVYIWAWDDSKNRCTFAGEWPGDMMTYDASKNLYYWESPEGTHPTMLIIHDNGRNRMYGINNVKPDGDTPFVNGATYHSDSSYTRGGDDPDPVITVAYVPGAYKSWSREGNTVVVNCENTTLYITPYSENVVKVFTLPQGADWEERRSITVVDTPTEDFDVVDREGEPLLVEIDNGTTVSIDRNTGLITFLDADGNEKLSEENYLRNAKGNHTVSFNSTGESAFFGGGYNGIDGNILGSELRIDNTQTGGWGQGRMGYPHCIAIPFVASSNGYGVLFDDHWRGAVMRPSRDGLSYQSGAQNPISYYYVGGDNLDDVIANYTSLTGRQDLPPYWALGYITSRYSYWSENEAQNIISDIKGAQIPLDGIVFDLGWEGADESGMGNLRWYRNGFPDPVNMMKEWKEKGIHTIAITEPYFTSSCVNYSEALQKGYFCDEDVSNMGWLRSSRVGLLDATNPEALDWMWSFYSARTREGMSGWWLDLGEPEQHDSDSRHIGGSVSQVHNEFGQLWIERVYNGLREEFPEMRAFIMPRSGTSGMQRFSTFPWTGDILRDWSGLAAQVPALINMSMSGVSYIGSDVGGFTSYYGPMPELYLRWVEFAVFSPMMRTHSADRPEPTNREYADVLPKVRDFINLRYRFLPYTYTLSYLNTTKGWPLARPACAYDRNPARLANVNDAYLWGKDLYVAPMLGSGRSRSISFPDGEWMDMNDFSKIYVGGETVNYSAPLDCLPYFMRRGSFIPMFTKTEGFGSTSEISYEDITLLHFADTSKEDMAEGIMYEDDRTSASSLEKEEYSLLHFRGEADSEGNYAVTVEPELGSSSHFMPEIRTIRLRLFGYNGVETPKLTLGSSFMPQTRAAESDEVELIRKNTREEVDAHEGHAYCLADNGEIYLKSVMPSSSKMTVSLGDISTGVTEIGENSALVLEYAGGYVNYSVPEGYNKASIEYISADGRILGRSDSLISDGRVHSLATSDLNGFCIARLSTCVDGKKMEKRIKFMK